MGQTDADSQDTASAPFVHLHTHTAHSKLDGLSRLDDLTTLVADDGAPALATTDHGNLDAAFHFDAAARKAGIKPIHGIETYLAIASEADEAKGNYFGSRNRRDFIQVPRGDAESGFDSDADTGDGNDSDLKVKRNEHLTVLAATAQGWANLVEINNDAQDDVHLWYYPRTDFEFLARRSSGLIALSGCLGGPVASRLLRGDVTGADRQFKKLLDVFGDDNVYVEIMEHGIKVEQRVTGELIALAKRFFPNGQWRQKIVATNDAHYLRESDASAHDHWLCIGQKKGSKPVLVTDENRFQFNGSGYHVRSAAEMRRLFDGEDDTSNACNVTLDIAERIEDDVFPAPYLRLPEFPVAKVVTHPEIYGEDVRTYTGPTEGPDAPKRFLRHLVRCGAKRRYGDPYSVAVSERLNMETPVIESMGFSSYFLSTWEVITWARWAGRRVGPGRGSAAGCAVSYCLGIVNVDPIENRLLFERFLKMDRAKMPDIDIDFDTVGGDMAVAHLIDFWGEDHVARIGTWGMSRSKKALKDIARVSDQVALGNDLAKLVPDDAGKPLPFARLLDESVQAAAAFRAKVASTEGAAELVAMAAAIEDVVAGQGIHACGVLVSDQPFDSLLDDDWCEDGRQGKGLVPLRYDRRKDPATNEIVKTKVTQWDGKAVEKVGFNKVDVLRLRNLNIVSECVRIIEENTGETVDADNPTMDPTDPRAKAAWDLLSSGRTAGLFQVESPGMTRLCEQIRPESLNDLSAIVALFRPGPLAAKMDVHYAARKSGEEPVDYGIFTSNAAEQDVIASVLGDTYGVILYQEQLMQLSEAVAGFDAEWRNRLQAAFSKKNRAEMVICGEAFESGALSEIRDESGALVKIAFAQSTVETLWETFRASADYLFNKSHSAAYGYLSYITAYLKANWPSEYGAAMLSCTRRENSAKRLAVLNSLRAEEIVVLPPSVNDGEASTSAHRDGTVRIGLSEIKDVGSAAGHIVAERKANGRFTSLHNLMTRVRIPQPDKAPTKLPTSTVEGLIESGALDEFGPRMGLLMVMRACFDRDDVLVPDAEWGALERSARERGRLGVILGEHPLVALREQVRSWRVPGMEGDSENLIARPISLASVARKEDRSDVLTLGVLSGWAEKSYSRGRMVNLTLEGSSAVLAGTAWDEAVSDMAARGIAPSVGQVVAVRGRLNVTVLAAPSVDVDDVDAEGFEGEVEDAAMSERRELTVWQVYPVDLDDDCDVVLDEVQRRADLSLLMGGLPADAPVDDTVAPATLTVVPPEQDEPERPDPEQGELFADLGVDADDLVDFDPDFDADVDAPMTGFNLAAVATDDFDDLDVAETQPHAATQAPRSATPTTPPVAVAAVAVAAVASTSTPTAGAAPEPNEILLKIDEDRSKANGKIQYWALTKSFGKRTAAYQSFCALYGTATLAQMHSFVHSDSIQPGDRSPVFTSQSGMQRCQIVASQPDPAFLVEFEARVQRLAMRAARRSA